MAQTQHLSGGPISIPGQPTSMGSIVVVTDNYVAAPSNRVLMVDASAGPVHITLPAANAAGQEISIIVQDPTFEVSVAVDSTMKLVDNTGAAFMGGGACTMGEGLKVLSDGRGTWFVQSSANNQCANWQAHAKPLSGGASIQGTTVVSDADYDHCYDEYHHDKDHCHDPNNHDAHHCTDASHKNGQHHHCNDEWHHDKDHCDDPVHHDQYHCTNPNHNNGDHHCKDHECEDHHSFDQFHHDKDHCQDPDHHGDHCSDSHHKNGDQHYCYDGEHHDSKHCPDPTHHSKHCSNGKHHGHDKHKCGEHHFKDPDDDNCVHVDHSAGCCIADGTIPGQTLYWDGTKWLANVNIFNDGGNVGIGTSSPQYQLDVAGTANVSGALTVGGGATITGGITIPSGSNFLNVSGSNGNAGDILVSQAGSAPVWKSPSTLGFMTSVVGTSPIVVSTNGGTATVSLSTVPITSGGTGATTASAAINNLVPTQSSTTNGQVLTSNGSYVSWGSVANGQVTAVHAGTGISVDATTGSVTVTNSGVLDLAVTSPITNTGSSQHPNIGLGLVPIANGGTNATDATTAFNNLAPSQGSSNNGKFLTTNGTNASWASLPTSVTTVTNGSGITVTGSGTASVTIANSGVLGVTGTVPIVITGSSQNPNVTLTQGSLTTSTTPAITIGGSGKTVGADITINIATASSGATGLLTSSDWTTFNGKIGAVNGSSPITVSTSGTTASVSLGTVPIGNGGTNAISANAAFNNLAPTQSSNGGKWLTTDGSNTSWSSLPTSVTTVTAGDGISVSGSGTSTVIVANTGLLSASGSGSLNVSSGQNPSISLTTGDLKTGTAGVTITGGTGVLVGSNASVDIATASSGVTGLLLGADWTTFNNKVTSITGDGYIAINGNATQPVLALATGDLKVSPTGVLTTSGSGKTVGSDITVTIAKADATHGGYLSSADWTTFSGKVNSVTGVSPIVASTDASNNVSVSLTLVPVTLGGTGNNAVNTGELLYGSATNVYSRLPISTIQGQVLAVTGSVPTWQDPAVRTPPTTAARNTFAGLPDGNYTLSGLDNTGYGYNTETVLTTGGRNSAFGSNALSAVTTGIDNVAIGNLALTSTLGGKSNVAVGSQALTADDIGTDNTGIGYLALDANTTGSSNTALGSGALVSNVSGSSNTALGVSANVSSGAWSNATAVGANAFVGESNALVLGSILNVNDGTGNTNVGIGTTTPSASLHVVGTMRYEDTHQATYNVLMSTDANGNAQWSQIDLGTTSVTGILPIARGGTNAGNAQAAFDNLAPSQTDNGGKILTTNGTHTSWTTAGSVGAVGPLANTGTVATGPQIELTGIVAATHGGTGYGLYNSGDLLYASSATGLTRLGIGSITNQVLTVVGGVPSWQDPSVRSLTSVHSTFAGDGAGNSAPTGTGNTSYGESALNAITTGSGNNAFGYAALLVNTTGSGNNAIGQQSMVANVGGSFNNANGFQALSANISGNNNVADGYLALASNTASDNTAVGYYALASNTSGVDNVAVGSSALTTNTTGKHDVATGYQALKNNNGDDNVATGYLALSGNNTGSNNIALGSNSLVSNNDGKKNIGIGTQSLATNTSGSNNVAAGYQSMWNNVDGHDNVGIGGGALVNNSSGSSNTAVGSNALATNVTGSNNSALGYNANVNAAALNNATAIGAHAVVTQSNSIVLGSLNGINDGQSNTNVGIGVTAPSASLHVVGTMRYADGSQASGSVLTSDANGNATWKSNTAVPTSRLISTGAGLTGGGNLTADRTISIDYNYPGMWLAPQVFSSSAATSTPIMVMGAVGQSADLQEWKDNNGNVLAYVNSKGDISAYDNFQLKGNIVLAMPATENLYVGSAPPPLTGPNNTAVGALALGNTISGNDNTAVGHAALSANVGGYENTAVGSSAMGANSAGVDNVAVGSQALGGNTAGSYNTAVGTSALQRNSDGNSTGNTAVGYSALGVNVSGTYNTAVGYSAGVTASDLSNTTAIGYNAKVAGDNTIQLGNDKVTAVNTYGAIASYNNGSEFGNSSRTTQLKIDGVADASPSDVFPSPVWDVAVTGDIAATGIIKAGAGISIDGRDGFPHQIWSDQALTIGTSSGIALTISSGSGSVSVVGDMQMEDGHLKSKQSSVPTVSVVSTNAASASLSGTDVAGVVTIEMDGSHYVASGDAVTIALNASYGDVANMVITLTPANAASAGAAAYATPQSDTKFNIGVTNGSSTGSYKFFYHIMQLNP